MWWTNHNPHLASPCSAAGGDVQSRKEWGESVFEVCFTSQCPDIILIDVWESLERVSPHTPCLCICFWRQAIKSEFWSMLDVNSKLNSLRQRGKVGDFVFSSLQQDCALVTQRWIKWNVGYSTTVLAESRTCCTVPNSDMARYLRKRREKMLIHFLYFLYLKHWAFCAL